MVAEHCHGSAKTLNEFQKELATYLNIRRKDMIVHAEKGSFYRSLTLSPEIIDQYSFTLGLRC